MKGISVQSTGQERNYLWMKGCVLLRAESISSVTAPKSQTGSILNFLWSVNRALATFVALKFIQEMHLANRYMSSVDLTDQFLQYYSFLHKCQMVKEILCALLEHGYTQCTYSPQEIFGQNNALAVQDTTSKAHVE